MMLTKTTHVSILKTPLETELFDPTLAVVLFQMSEAFSRTPYINLGETFPQILIYMENTAVMLFAKDYTPGNFKYASLDTGKQKFCMLS